MSDPQPDPDAEPRLDAGRATDDAPLDADEGEPDIEAFGGEPPEADHAHEPHGYGYE